MIGAAEMTSRTMRRPSGTRKVRGEVLNTRAKAKAVERSQGRRDAFYDKIGELYGDGEKGAAELLKRAKLARSMIAAKLPPATGLGPTASDKVSSPTVPGAREDVQRVIDTLASMLRRRQLTAREYEAADRIRTAHAKVFGSMGGAMDFERARGSSSPGGFGESYRQAAEYLSDIKRFLYPKDYPVVYHVCCLGYSIEQTAQRLPRIFERDGTGRVTRASREEAGRRLKAGLEAAADLWWPEKASMTAKDGAEIRPMRAVVSERPEWSDGLTEVPKASAVHATGKKIYRSGGKS